MVVAALVDSGREGGWAESVIEGGDLIGPEIVLAEASNTLRRLEITGSLSPLVAQSTHADLHNLHVDLYPYVPFAQRVWELRPNLTAYEAWYVAMAEALDCPLATLDRRMARAGRTRCKFLLPRFRRTKVDRGEPAS